MRRILLIFKNDLKRRLKAPASVIVLMLIPLIMTALMGAIFAPSSGGENKLPKIKVLLTDNDKNIASKILLGAFGSKELKEMFQVTTVDEKEGKKRIGKGDASALIIIPKKFTDNLVKGKNVGIQVIKNPSERFLPTVVEEFMNTLAVMISGLFQVFEPEIKMMDQFKDVDLENVSMASLLPMMEKSKEKIVALKKYVSPLLIALKKEVAEKEKKEENTGVNVFGLILPAISIMFLLFIIEIFLRDILSEREDGKLQRIMFSPARSIEYIGARIVSGWLMGVMVYLLVVVSGIVFFGVSWGNYLHLFLFVAVTCFWIAGFLALLNSFFKNRNQAGAITAPVILVFSTFGGSIIPVEQLPDAFHFASHITLNYWFIRGVRNITAGTFPLLPFIVLLVSSLVLFSLAVVFLKRRLTVNG